ncbi:MAG: hypothetical protein DRG78_19850 [Epsilonproteobacteria bacterium]|nr:MAG: hypothetical protein DRG78_19850 [Campylobacterota bacterium]
MKRFSKLILSFLMLLSTVVLNADDVEGDVSAYLVGSHMDVKSARKKLKDAGYEILVTYKSVKKGHTIVFTNDALKREAAKPTRAHAAVLRLFVDDKEKSISITNPVYFGKAFMQDDYNHKVFNAELESLSGAFGELTGSKDKLEFDDIGGYHFMMGMPYYEDPDELATGSDAELLEKLRSYKKGKSLLFELKLSEKTTLIGYDLGKRTKKFVKKIGRANGAVLPYCIVVEDGVATSLAAKYYLAVSYPLLSMGEFMGISTVPGAITQDLEKPFKQVKKVSEVEEVEPVH